MTIAERKAREAYDLENPWRPLSEAISDGMICELRASDMTGLTDFGRSRFFLDQDGTWYRIEPPRACNRWIDHLTEFRPTGVKISTDRQASVISRAENRAGEYSAGRWFRKPKPYKLYWRADD